MEHIEEKTDDELIREHLAGVRDVFPVIINRYTNAVYAFVFRFVRNKEDAEDITQETFIKAWKKIETYREGANFKTWIFQIAHNTAIDYLRKRKHLAFSDLNNQETETTFEETIPDTLPLPDELLEKKFDQHAIEGALEMLSPLYREVLLLYYTNDFTFAQIGELLARPLHTVKSQHRRALIELRKILGDLT